ncbi:hypothetical protein IJH29_02500 [Candidatus Saccharibacteria bacterium]|nr:hypothetical protein [Candidatus Saccharibacteria bacterium]
MLKLLQKFKSGATSIYVVVIATLLFGVITVSFIRIIVGEASRTTSDELAQSAYDSALAGVEDAKVALKKYQECLLNPSAVPASSGAPTCSEIQTAMETSFNSVQNNGDLYCDAVQEALGRATDSGSGVTIQEKNTTDESIVQAYTCVVVNNVLADYRASLSSSGTLKVIPLKSVQNPTEVTAIKISWYSKDDSEGQALNFANQGGRFGNTTSYPPTISAQVIQTAPSFSLSDLDVTKGDDTDRATVFLVPTKNSGNNYVGKDVLYKSNDHTSENTPQDIYCDENTAEEFYCSAVLALPEPVNGPDRNADTFLLVLSLPYGTPDTTFSVQMCTGRTAGQECNTTTPFQDAQISIDSTGRANDMYSRVEARVEFTDSYFPYAEFAIQATGNGSSSIDKNFYVTVNCIKVDAQGNVDLSGCSNSGTPSS